MTNKEAIGVIKFEIACVNRQDTPRCKRDCANCDLCLPTEDVLEAFTRAIKALEEKIWTPTSEMPPEEYDSYLVMWRPRAGEYTDRLFYEICEYDPDEDEWERIEQAGEAGAEIVAWMPLPKPYEPKETDNERVN